MKHATKHIYTVSIFVYTAFQSAYVCNVIRFPMTFIPFLSTSFFFLILSLYTSLLLLYSCQPPQYHTIIFVLSQKLLCKNCKELNSLNEKKNVLNRPKQREIFYLLTVNENLIFYKRKLKPKNLFSL